MSEITKRIEGYRAGDVTLDDLVEELGTKRFKKPKRFTDADRKKSALWRSENYDPIEGDEGTWDEVVSARDRGLLTDKEYLAIVRRADKHKA